MQEFIIQKNEEQQRLDKYLKKLLPNATSSFLYKMLRKKNIVLNGKKAAGNEKLNAKDVVQLFFSEETFAKFHADTESLKAEYEYLKALPWRKLPIVYEDAEMLIADKPYNMLSQKAAASDISANEYLLSYMINKGDLSFREFQTFRPSVVNRLDRNTTGLLLFGKTLHALQQLGADIRERRIHKYYLAVVAGELKKPLHLNGYLQKDSTANMVSYSEVQSEDADAIETKIQPLQSKHGLTLAEIHLITGKTHQIRLHLASIGCPIVGDPKYGNADINRTYAKSHKIHHQLLHAYRLEFPDGRVVISEPEAVFTQLFIS